jgi:hypothetical protein
MRLMSISAWIILLFLILSVYRWALHVNKYIKINVRKQTALALLKNPVCPLATFFSLHTTLLRCTSETQHCVKMLPMWDALPSTQTSHCWCFRQPISRRHEPGNFFISGNSQTSFLKHNLREQNRRVYASTSVIWEVFFCGHCTVKPCLSMAKAIRPLQAIRKKTRRDAQCIFDSPVTNKLFWLYYPASNPNTVI